MSTPILIEKVESRKWSFGYNQSVDLVYILTGVSDDVTASTIFAGGVPTAYYGLPRQTIDFEADWVDVLTGDGRWVAHIHYARLPSQTGDSSFSFDTAGGMQHVTQSISTTAKYPNVAPLAPDCRGAIGVTNDGVEGVDVPIPSYNFSETHYIADAIITPAYKGILSSLTAHVNDALFKNLSKGECLFLGAAGSKRGDDDWEITFRFAGSPNRADFTIGKTAGTSGTGGITGIYKEGWEYMWVRYADTVDEDQLVKQPVAVYIEKVIEYGNFALLGIGT